MIDASTGLAAVESFFGMGVSVAPMPGAVDGAGATLFRYLPAMDDPWSGGLHLDEPPTAETIGRWLSTWEAFDAPGAMRWVQPEGSALDGAVLEAVASAGFEAGRRSIRDVGSPPSDGPGQDDGPAGVEVAEITGDVRDWAAFEVMARWIDSDVDPDRWRWRANRVRHLVEGGRGRAWLARTPGMPVGAAIVLDPPDHRAGVGPAAAVVVHALHRGVGVGRRLLREAVDSGARVATSLGPVDGRGQLVEVGRPIRPRPARS